MQIRAWYFVRVSVKRKSQGGAGFGTLEVNGEIVANFTTMSFPKATGSVTACADYNLAGAADSYFYGLVDEVTISSDPDYTYDFMKKHHPHPPSPVQCYYDFARHYEPSPPPPPDSPPPSPPPSPGTTTAAPQMAVAVRDPQLGVNPELRIFVKEDLCGDSA
ncbi:hypothetical protein RI054_01g00530 [Pseudoscourfieldia marina]